MAGRAAAVQRPRLDRKDVAPAPRCVGGALQPIDLRQRGGQLGTVAVAELEGIEFEPQCGRRGAELVGGVGGERAWGYLAVVTALP